MTQHLLVQAEVTPPVIKSASANKVSASDNTEVQPFSSELNKQIDKHVKTAEKAQDSVEQSGNAHPTKQQDKDSKAEKLDVDDGKNLPKETSSATEKSTDEDVVAEEVTEISTQSDVAVEVKVDVLLTSNAPIASENKTVEVVKQVDSPAVKKVPKQKIAVAATPEAKTEPAKQAMVRSQENSAATTKATNIELPETAKSNPVKQVLLASQKHSEVNTHIKETVDAADDKPAVKTPALEVTVKQVVKAQQTGAALKSSNVHQQDIMAVAKAVPQNAVEGLSSDQKKSASALRPDILYGINKKYSEQGSKLDLSGATEKVMTSDRMMAKAISEGQLMADDIRQVKPGLQQSAPIAERGHALGSLVTAHTPAATVSQGQATTATPVLDIQPALQSAAWNRVMSGRVVWMAREGVQQAELKLNPANLGPVEVRLTMNNEQTSVTFIANHAATRDALEQALPKLRESFTENGMELADAEVTQHSSEQQNQDDAAETDGSGILKETAAESEEFSGEEQPQNNEQEELDIGLSLYA
ncbi:hypothetical protein A9Q79_00150 [Methylophaga sp. 42_25_T18]|nr:hypothetical protein A9Q79_00150 [Methylophaga sp. 42_25_T18]OUR88179.1 hypothetical protein A9Q92_03185 [Methylophaga sp. 42_8_T64]